MNQHIRNTIAAVSLASLLAATAGCGGVEATDQHQSPVPVEQISGSALPSAADLTGEIPTAPGIDEFTPEEEELPPEQPGKETTCRGFRITDVLFSSGSIDLEATGLKAIADFATAIPEDATIDIVGHTDNVPIDIGNQRLSELRADSVATALEAHLNAGQRVVHIRGAADSDPIADNVTDDGRQRNRRVEVLVNCGSET